MRAEPCGSACVCRPQTGGRSISRPGRPGEDQWFVMVRLDCSLALSRRARTSGSLGFAAYAAGRIRGLGTVSNPFRRLLFRLLQIELVGFLVVIVQLGVAAPGNGGAQ